jgi:hypothetical protein
MSENGHYKFQSIYSVSKFNPRMSGSCEYDHETCCVIEDGTRGLWPYEIIWVCMYTFFPKLRRVWRTVYVETWMLQQEPAPWNLCYLLYARIILLRCMASTILFLQYTLITARSADIFWKCSSNSKKMLFTNWRTQNCELLHINNTRNKFFVVAKGFRSLFGDLSTSFNSVEGEATTLGTLLICHQHWSILSGIAPLTGDRCWIQLVRPCLEDTCPFETHL